MVGETVNLMMKRESRRRNLFFTTVHRSSSSLEAVQIMTFTSGGLTDVMSDHFIHDWYVFTAISGADPSDAFFVV